MQNRTATINITYGSEMTQEHINAMEYAKSIWETIICSEVPIEIYAAWTWIPNTNILAGAFINTTYMSHDLPDMIPSSDYVPSLANHIAGYDIHPNVYDFEIGFNDDLISDNIFHYDYNLPCPSTKYDFVTLCLHEIGHGLGLASSVLYDGQSGYSWTGTRPNVYDRFVNRIFSNGQSPQTLTSIPHNSVAEIHDFCTSNSVYWLSPNADMPEPKLSAPPVFQEGASINHLDGTTYPEDLFGPTQLMGPGNHNISSHVKRMLKDIGWDCVELTTGINDKLYIHGFNQNGFNQFGGLPNNYVSPVTVLEVGNKYYYAYEFQDELPYDMLNVTTRKWTLELYHTAGKVMLEECEGEVCCDLSPGSAPVWTLNVPSLPDGYTFLRNALGHIKGRIHFTVDDMNGGHRNAASLEVGIKYPPGLPIVQINNLNSYSCSSANLSFSALGALNYRLEYRNVNTPSWTTVHIPQGQSTYTVNNLIETDKYEFFVYAINNEGETASEPILRTNCKVKFISYPNPATDRVKVENIDNLPLDEAKLVNMNDPSQTITKDGDGTATELEIETNNLPAGTYKLDVKDTEGKESTKTIIKF